VIRVGLIGLGAMGAPMARRLLGAGFPLAVWSRTRAKADALAEEGAVPADSPAGVARGSEVVVSMLPDAPEVEQVLFGDDGVAAGANRGALAVDMSTIAPASARSFAERLAGLGIGFLDAPVSGGPEGAAAGSLSIMVGGEPEAFERARPVFEALGSTIAHLGPVGAGQLTKACNQLVTATTVELVAEMIALATRAGLDPERVREVLLGGYAQSRILEVHGRRMIDRSFEPGFRASLLAKDVRIVRSIAEELGLELPAFSAAAARVDRLVAEGGGELDPSALFGLLDA
jgi:2-hydroxy-3-oxopropionate reductase